MSATPLPPPPPPPPVRSVEGVAAAREELAATTADLEATIARAAALSDDDRHRRVDDEWSVVESLRHLVLVVDVWLSKTILGEDDPFHPMALPPSFMPPRLPGSSIDPDARPTFDEACEVLRGRLARVEAYLAAVTDDELARPVHAHAGTVAGALGVLLDELRFHRGFMERDLGRL